MINKKSKQSILLLSFISLFVFNATVRAESLFKAGISQSTSPITPKSWFAGIRASNIGDMVTIFVDEKTSTEDTVDLQTSQKSDLQDNFTPILDKIFPGKGVVPNLDGWGAANKVSNSSSLKKTSTLSQTITTQVVQVLPNGNLVVQGRKSVVNAGERQDIIISGIVNPRLIDGLGQVKSSTIANLQIAVLGKGTVSRSQSNGVMSRFLRLFF